MISRMRKVAWQVTREVRVKVQVMVKVWRWTAIWTAIWTAMPRRVGVRILKLLRQSLREATAILCAPPLGTQL
jgi:hypothetical protein